MDFHKALIKLKRKCYHLSWMTRVQLSIKMRCEIRELFEILHISGTLILFLSFIVCICEYQKLHEYKTNIAFCLHV